MIRLTFRAFCAERKKDELLSQWDAEKNQLLTPDNVTFGSHKLVWWRCPKGHSYRAMVKSRAQGTGCPYCTGRAVLAEENSLAARFPDLAQEWDGDRNGDLTPSQVSAGTHSKVWWRCKNGHSWQAAVFSRTQNRSGCPVCAGRQALAGETDLKTRCPALVQEWDDEKNGALTPEMVTPGSNRRVWWRCEKGHAYQAVIAQRVQGSSGCPYCSSRRVLPGFNDLSTAAPHVAAQWHESLNGPLSPEQVTAGSHKKVWWQCSHGHVWKAVVYARTGAQQSGCPVCAGKARQKQ